MPTEDLLSLPLPRVRLGHGPTAVCRLEGLEASEGPELWVKDDGAFGRHGGNKARKLEWLLGDARERGHQTVLTSGALGTNHGLATALYARELGMEAILVLVPQPLDEHVRSQLGRIRASGAELHFAESTAGALLASARVLSRRSGRRGRGPYLILPGGSTPLGCVGYVEAAFELRRQVEDGSLPEPASIVVALGSGGTAAGLVLGLRLAGLRSRLHCVLVNDITPISTRSVVRLARRTQGLLHRRGAGLPQVLLRRADVEVDAGWLGAGYGYPSAPAGEARRELAAAGVDLEPVYSAKAAAKVLQMTRTSRRADGPILFWNTHGASLGSSSD